VAPGRISSWPPCGRSPPHCACGVICRGLTLKARLGPGLIAATAECYGWSDQDPRARSQHQLLLAGISRREELPARTCALGLFSNSSSALTAQLPSIMNPYNTRSQGEPSPGLGRGRGAPTPSPDRPARSRSLSPVGRSTPPTAGASPSAHLPHSAAAPTSELPAASAAGASGLETTSASQAPSTSGVANNLPGAAAGTAAQQSTLERSIFDLSRHGALSTPAGMQAATDIVLQATADLGRGPFGFGSPTPGPTPTGTASGLQQPPSLNLQPPRYKCLYV